MADDTKKSTVPLKKVVLYKHGMGYFERRGPVDGNASLEILCGAAEIDDMLKSLMVLTGDGARVKAITYDSAKTLEDRMTDFGFDIRTAKGLIDIIAQMKGLPVTVTSSGTKTSGRVVGLDFLDHVVEENKVVREPFLILLSDATMRRLSLAAISAIDVDDASFSGELNQQLELLFRNAKKKDKKALTVNLPDTKGEVVVAYSIPSPIWKTSYRLVLAEDKVLMQGMAIVDNVQDEDWQNVQMVLVSAAPISFIQPLYDPVQPARRRIKAQGYVSAGPVTAERAQREEANALWGEVTPQSAPTGGWGAPSPAAMAQMQAPGAVRKRAGVGSLEESTVTSLMGQLTAGGEAATGVEAGSSGELFEYRISEPVTVPRNTSALIPIVQEIVEGERISLYNSQKDKSHPYSTVRLKNTSGLTLESGPVTVVEEDAYAGEALLDVLKPDDTRFLPYALDRDCHVIVRNTYEEKPIWRVRALNQYFYMDRRSRTATIYRIENLADKKKTLYIEHPVNASAKIVGDSKPTETTESFHRFEVKLAPKQLQELSVIEEQEISRGIWIGEPESVDTNTLKWVIDQNILDKETATYIKALLQKHNEIAIVREQLQAQQALLAQHNKDQERARENLKALGTTNERYRKAIDEAEDRIMRTTAEIGQLTQQFNQLRREFLNFVQKELESILS